MGSRKLSTIIAGRVCIFSFGIMFCIKAYFGPEVYTSTYGLLVTQSLLYLFGLPVCVGALVPKKLWYRILFMRQEKELKRLKEERELRKSREEFE